MAVLVVPELDKVPYPTLGPQLCSWIEENLVFGPGDLRGEPARLDAEKRGLIYRAYEVYPQDHPQAGRRRFKRVCFNVRKAWAKTELGAWLTACELHPAAPVRCSGFDARGQPIGVGVTDPYIPMLAYTEEQSEELAYGALRVILGLSRVARDFDIGLARILRRDGDGKAVPLATAPDSRDGARTTFQLFDEVHRFVLPRQKEAHRVMLANAPKRRAGDAWSLELTTAPAPGEGSVAENTLDYARQVAGGKISDSRLFFFYRFAGDSHDLETEDGRRAAVLEASGPVAEWSDVEGILEQWRDPTADRTYLERVWLNRVVRGSERAFDAELWRTLAKPGTIVADGDTITLGFDGARYEDATSIVATHVRSGYQWLVGLWERPHGIETWEVPEAEVRAAMEMAFERWRVWRLYADPPYWETTVAEWAGRWGEERVVQWRTNRQVPIAWAARSFANAIKDREVSHDGSAGLSRHIGNAIRRKVPVFDDQRQQLWMIQKERSDSPHKIDAAMAAILSWEARRDALAAGVGQKAESVYEERGLVDPWGDEDEENRVVSGSGAGAD